VSFLGASAVSLSHFYFAGNDFFEPMIYLSTRSDLGPISVGLRTFNTLCDSQPNPIQSGKRFEIVRVDFETMTPTIKASGAWYRDFLAGTATT
jgi:hypothetical protein